MIAANQLPTLIALVLIKKKRLFRAAQTTPINSLTISTNLILARKFFSRFITAASTPHLVAIAHMRKLYGTTFREALYTTALLALAIARKFDRLPQMAPTRLHQLLVDNYTTLRANSCPWNRHCAPLYHSVSVARQALATLLAFVQRIDTDSNNDIGAATTIVYALITNWAFNVNLHITLAHNKFD